MEKYIVASDLEFYPYVDEFDNLLDALKYYNKLIRKQEEGEKIYIAKIIAEFGGGK